MRTLHCRVAGTTYEGRQDVLAMMHGTELCRIEPEPSNPYDANALAVKVAFPSEANIGIKHVGYIPRDLAKDIAPYLEGENLMVEIEDITGGFEYDNGQTAYLGLRLKVEIPEAETE